MSATHDHLPYDLHDHHDHIHPQPGILDWLRVVLLIGLGLYFVYNIIAGNLTNYINERFAWLSYVAAAIYLLIGLYGLWALLRVTNHNHAHDHHDDHDHGHSHGTSWIGLLVVSIPLVLGTLIPSRPLGAAAVSDVNITGVSGATSTTTISTPPEERNILDWLRAFNTVSDYAQLNNQPADVIGFVYREPDFGDERFMVARFTISCCVADSSAIGLPVAWTEAGELQADTWVRVQGAFQVGDFRGDSVPVLQADSIEIVAQPEHPYLYP
jgi:uncharacterized repeat protein (TIGR03943 family)